MSRFGRARLALTLAAVTVVGVLPAIAPARESLDDCIATDVAGVGPACALPNGLFRVTLSDGTSLITHGADPVFGDWDETAVFNKLKPIAPSCIRDRTKEFHVQLLYARPSDVSRSRFGQLLPKIKDLVGRVNAMLTREAKPFGVPSMRYRMPCAGGQVSISQFALSTTKANTWYGSSVEDARAAGFTNPYAKYWLWVDAGKGALGGVSDISGNDELVPENTSNMGPNYAVFFGLLGGFGASVVMHEASHGMGAVQSTSPNANVVCQGGYCKHCTDDPDVMCYASAAPEDYRDGVCKSPHFDCNNDDYFNPKPSSSKKHNYIRTHWNLGSPINRYFAGCSYGTGILTAGTAGQDVDTVVRGAKPDWARLAWNSHSISKGCWGHPFAVSGMTVLPGVPGQVPSGASLIGGSITSVNQVRGVLASVPVDVDACFYKSSTLLKCYASGAYEKGSVPKNATSVRVIVNKGVNVTWVFSAV